MSYKPLIVISLFLLLSSTSAKALDVSVTTLNFFQDGPYVEIYSRILSHSIQFAGVDNQPNTLVGSLELLITISDSSNMVYVDKYILNSPHVEAPTDFWDLKRIPLQNGEYKLDIRYVDQNNITDTLKYSQKLMVNITDSEISSSDILLMSSVSEKQENFAFQKAGFSFEPLMFNLFGSRDEILIFYNEFYGLPNDKNQLYYSYVVRNVDTGEPIGKPGVKKLGITDGQQVMEKFSIADLSSGNYKLELEVKDREMVSHYKKVQNFAVHHPLSDYRSSIPKDAIYETSFVQIMTEGEINYALKAIFPRVSGDESGFLADLIWDEDVEAKRYFLYSFWSKFSVNNSSELYNQYMKVAGAIDRLYNNNVGHGFETDRGYMFLKYGQPDDIVSVEDEPSAPPYEIWIYNYLEETRQNNVKFLFYNPSVVTNDYILLHSTCRGEINNPQWEVKLYDEDADSAIGNSLDRTEVEDGLNRNARRYFSDF